MKISNVSKLVGAGVLAASIAVVPLNLPAHAQGTTGTSTQQDGNSNAAGPISANTDSDNNNWGWLGLLGLAGLAGLAKKKHNQTTHTVSNDPNIGVRSGNDLR